MPDVSLEAFARYYGVGSLGGLAQKAHKHWPPPPQISIREVVGIIGLPLAPTNGEVAESADGTRMQCSFSWQDEGAGTVLQATSWAWKIHTPQASTAQGTVIKPSAGPIALGNGTYSLDVAQSNQFGTGPDQELFQFNIFVGDGPSKPTIEATVASTDVVTVTGHGFQANEVVHLQATVKGGPTTPPLAATNAQDTRTQYPHATATGSGTFTALIEPEGFGLAQFQGGAQAYVIAGESIATMVVNNGSNIVTVTAPSTV